jgi:hypothetical protein
MHRIKAHLKESPAVEEAIRGLLPGSGSILNFPAKLCFSS